MTWAVSNPYAVAATGGTYQTPNWAVQPYTEHLYDAIGRESTTKNPDGTGRGYGYLQWTTTITDENGHQTKKVADFLGRTAQVQELKETETYTTRYDHDAMDRLRIVTNNSGKTIVMNYDWLSRKTQLIDPDLGTWTYVYDDAGNLTTQTDARGCTTSLTYDALNRVTGKTYSGPGACGSGATVGYGYDEYDGVSKFGRGRRTSMTEKIGTTTTGTTQWVYDKQGRLTRQTNTFSGAPDAYTTRWTYDAMDRARSMTYPDDETVNMAYNEQTLVKSITSTLSSYVTASNYNPANQLTSLTLGNGVTTNYAYDPKNLRLKTLQTAGGTLQNLQYGYDPVGNVKTITDALRSEVSTFGYDNLDRLTSVSVTGGTNPYNASWTYNPIGNITQMVQAGVTKNYTYDPTRIHAVTQVRSQTYSYDPNGNMANRNGDVLLYDEENRLQRVTATNGTTTVYGYNGDGQRVKREVADSGSRTITFYVGNWLEVQTSTTATPTPTNTPPPTLTPTITRTPTNTPVPTSTPTPSLPGSGSLQTQSDFVVGNTLYQAYWRGDQGWSRTVPIVNGVIVWTSRSAWSGPLSISGMPGSGNMQTQSDFAVGNTLYQAFWRGDQGWVRTVPIANGVIQWSSASVWGGPFPISGHPGSGALQATGDYVVGNMIFQDVWRGDQRWSRTVPIANGTPQWSSASAWSGPTDASSLPGSGTLQTESNFIVGNTFYQAYWIAGRGWARTVPIVNGVIQWGSATAWGEVLYLASLVDGNSYWCWLSTSNAGGSDGSLLANTPAARDTERSGTCAPPPPALASPARVLNGTVTKYYYFGAQRVAMRTASGVTYLHGDHLGSTSVTADSSGTETARQTYYAYGTVRTISGTLPTDYTFTGQKLDASSSLMYYGARYYDAAIGRFAQPDSLVPNPYNPQSLNRYSYVLNNPVKYTDPTGHDIFIVGGAGSDELSGGEDPYDDPASWETWIREYTGWSHEEFLDKWYDPWMQAKGNDEVKMKIAQETGVGVFKWDVVNGRQQFGFVDDGAKALQQQINNWGMKDVTIVAHSKGGKVLESLLGMYESGALEQGQVKKMVSIDPPQNWYANLFAWGGNPSPDAQKAKVSVVSIPAFASCLFSACASNIQNDIELAPAKYDHTMHDYLSYTAFRALSIVGDAHANPQVAPYRWVAR